MLTVILFGALLFPFFTQTCTLELKTIGIFSICGDNYTENEFSRFAHTMDLFISKAYIAETTSYYVVPINTSYKSFDVCFDHMTLTSILTDLLLDSEYYAVNKSLVLVRRYWDWVEVNGTYTFQTVEEKFRINSKRNSLVIRLITHIPGDLLQTLLDILSVEGKLAITKHSELVQTSDRMNRRAMFYNMEDHFKDVERYLKTKDWQEFIVVLIKTSFGGDFTFFFENFVNMLHNMRDGICIKTLTVSNKNDSVRLERNIEKDYIESNKTKQFMVVLIGQPFSIQLNRSAEYYKNIIGISPYYFHFWPFEWLIWSIDAVRSGIINSRHPDQLESYIESKDARDILLKDRAVFMALRLILEVRLDLVEDNPTWDDLIFNIHEPMVKLFGNAPPTVKLPKSITCDCVHPICPPGHEKVFGKFPNDTTLWDKEFGYFCKPCRGNYIKPSKGDARCHPCLDYFISTSDKTHCFDPLVISYHQASGTVGLIIVSFCCVSGIFCLLVIVVFIKCRETGIVKTSDLPMSLAHLIVILSFFGVSPLLFFTIPKVEVCMARTLSIAVLYNLNISIVFTKSNKLVSAFSSNIRSTKSEVLKTTFMQGFIIVMNSISACSLVASLWSNDLPGVAERLDIKNTRKFLYCNNIFDNIMLSCFMLLLQLFCFIQAFRCRKLPGHLNEAMNILYASFIASVSLSVMFPIQYFQDREEDSELVVILILLGNSMVLFLFMYANKVFTVLFRPEKNTKEYFRRKQMEMIEQRAKQI